MTKAPRKTQTLRAGCSKAEPKNFAPPQTPFPEARDSHNLPTNPFWWGSMHAISSYRGNTPTNKQTNKHTHTHTHTHTDKPTPHTDRTDYNTLHRS